MNGYEEEEEYYDADDTRVDTATELIQALIDPVVAKRHKNFVSKDLAISNIPRSMADETMARWNRYASIIFDFDFIGVPKMANIYNAQWKVESNMLRSINGFERVQQTTTTKISKTDAPKEERSFGLGRRGSK